MIERLYVDNVWSYVNFEWRPGPLAILLGANGSGKTALLDTLSSVQGLLNGTDLADEAFPARSLTRWDQRNEQTVELEVRGNNGLYLYRLVLEHSAEGAKKPRIMTELLTFDGQPLVERSQEGIRLSGRDSLPFPLIAGRSGVSAVAPGKTNPLAWFKNWLEGLWLLRPDPRAMRAEVEGIKDEWLEQDLSNFTAWYLYQLRQKPGAIFKANQVLTQIMPGFLELFEQNGRLRARFGDESKNHSFEFNHLSDGQRALIALYVLRHTVALPGKTLVIDEPDNYVALREIQPWLTELVDMALRKDGPQIWLISHHPEVLNLLARDYGWLFFRDGHGPTRVKRFVPAEGLDAGETIARGWEDA